MTKAEKPSEYINTTDILKNAKWGCSEIVGDGQQVTHFSIVESAGEGDRELVLGDRKFKVPRMASIKPDDEPVTGEEKLDALSSFACIALEQLEGHGASSMPKSKIRNILNDPTEDQQRAEDPSQHLAVLQGCVDLLRNNMMALEALNIRMDALMRGHNDPTTVRLGVDQVNGTIRSSLRMFLKRVNCLAPILPYPIQTTIRHIVASFSDRAVAPNTKGRLVGYCEEVKVLLQGVFGLAWRLFQIMQAYVKDIRRPDRRYFGEL